MVAIREDSFSKIERTRTCTRKVEQLSKSWDVKIDGPPASRIRLFNYEYAGFRSDNEDYGEE